MEHPLIRRGSTVHTFIIVFILHNIIMIASADEMKSEIESFRNRFYDMKESTITCLERCKITVLNVVFMLTHITAMNQDQIFVQEKHKELNDCRNHWELFGALNYYWNYLAYDLFDQLIGLLFRRDNRFDKVQRAMEIYKTDIQTFQERTELEIYCQAVPSSLEDDPPPGFRKLVVEFNWVNGVTLAHVEMFRIRYAHEYKLHKCALMVNSIKKGSFTVTWFVSATVIEMLKKNRTVELFREFDASTVDVDGICIHQTFNQQQVS